MKPQSTSTTTISMAAAGIGIIAASITLALVLVTPPEPVAAAQQPGKGYQATVAISTAPAAEVDKPYYALTDAERELVESIVMAEAGNQGLHGQMLVAQCILAACLDDDIRPAEAIERYKYTKPHPEPTAETREAVAAVFDRGELPSTEPIKYFYSTRYCDGRWHETQIFVVEHLDHRFFAERRLS